MRTLTTFLGRTENSRTTSELCLIRVFNGEEIASTFKEKNFRKVFGYFGLIPEIGNFGALFDFQKVKNFGRTLRAILKRLRRFGEEEIFRNFLKIVFVASIFSFGNFRNFFESNKFGILLESRNYFGK